MCRRNKVLNHFSIMQQRRLKDQDQDEDEEEKEKRSRKKPSELRIHDLEDDLEMSSDGSDASGEEGERGPRGPSSRTGLPGKHMTHGTLAEFPGEQFDCSEGALLQVAGLGD